MSKSNIKPLVRGIYYMYLSLCNEYQFIIHTDKNAEKNIRDIMKLYRMPRYSTLIEVRGVLIKELLKNSKQGSKNP